MCVCVCVSSSLSGARVIRDSSGLAVWQATGHAGVVSARSAAPCGFAGVCSGGRERHLSGRFCDACAWRSTSSPARGWRGGVARCAVRSAVPALPARLRVVALRRLLRRPRRARLVRRAVRGALWSHCAGAWPELLRPSDGVHRDERLCGGAQRDGGRTGFGVLGARAAGHDH